MSVEAATERVIRFHLNGEPVSAQIANHHTLVELLQRLGLTGARESCAQGLCGCCTVLVNGLAVSACLYLAAFVDDAEVITIEQAQGDDRQRMLATTQQAKSATLRSPSGRDATMAHRDLRPGTSRGASSLTPNPSPGGRGERCVPARRAG
ncbi:MAG: 2Fe-2S iron-sulfur cluster binding domain-containing protein, partial [Burkholderiales bacterium]|nr:2Fe-2S iron-sulfur cluster binding domain-containing protein [Burkholderiales bacterium]